jgi:lipopolysaccharide export system protein LptC
MVLRGRKSLKRLLAVALAVSVLALAGILAVNRWLRTLDPKEVLETIPDGATIAIGRIHQTSTKDGVAEWTLTAASGRYEADAKTLALTDLSVVYHLKDRGDVELEASSGILNTETHSMEASGGVVVRHEGFTLKTEKVSYDHSSRVLATEADVHIEGRGMMLEARRMSVDLEGETARFVGEVKGRIDDRKSAD